MKVKTMIVAAFALLMDTGCNGQNKNNMETFQETSLQNKQTSNSGNMSKSIVIFFSHAGDNYSVGVIDTGNTKIVADYISEITGADQFEIVTHKYDGMAYTPLIELAKKEAAAGELPPYEGTVPTSAATTPSSSAVPYGGAPTRRSCSRYSRTSTSTARPSSPSRRTRAADWRAA